MRIEVKEKRYGKKIAIRNIDLTMPPGTASLVIGTSGAGKSTLINCVIKSPDKYVSFDKPDPKIAYIQQHPALNKMLSVYDSIYFAARFEHLFAADQEIRKQVDYYINLLGLGYVSNSAVKALSGGQQQRVAIAKELVRGADILIADEIDTGLDCGVAHFLARTLVDISHSTGVITLVISHNVINIPLYDQIIVLAKDSQNVGRVAYKGPPVHIKRFFSIQEYYDILTKINTEAEGGQGLGDYYIDFIDQHWKGGNLG